MRESIEEETAEFPGDQARRLCNRNRPPSPHFPPPVYYVICTYPRHHFLSRHLDYPPSQPPASYRLPRPSRPSLGVGLSLAVLLLQAFPVCPSPCSPLPALPCRLQRTSSAPSSSLGPPASARAPSSSSSSPTTRTNLASASPVSSHLAHVPAPTDSHSSCLFHLLAPPDPDCQTLRARPAQAK